MELVNELEKIIEHFTHDITDSKGNKWKVLELSDVSQAIDDYKESLKQ